MVSTILHVGRQPKRVCISYISNKCVMCNDVQYNVCYIRNLYIHTHIFVQVSCLLVYLLNFTLRDLHTILPLKLSWIRITWRPKLLPTVVDTSAQKIRDRNNDQCTWDMPSIIPMKSCMCQPCVSQGATFLAIKVALQSMMTRPLHAIIANDDSVCCGFAVAPCLILMSWTTRARFLGSKWSEGVQTAKFWFIIAFTGLAGIIPCQKPLNNIAYVIKPCPS